MNLLILLGAIGTWEAVLIVIAILVLFGGKKIPELMKGLGEGMKEFKKATKAEGQSTNEAATSQKEDAKK